MQERINTFVLAVLAGVFIALGGLLFLVAKSWIPGEWGLFVGALLFPVGLITICFLGFNLYTGKIGLVFRKNTNKTKISTVEWLLWILLGNAAGAFLLGISIYPETLRDTAFSSTVIATGKARETIDPTTLFVKSILCGALVYLAVFFFKESQSVFGKVCGIIVPISFFVFAGHQHCVANMFYMAASGCWSTASLVSLLLCICGNSFGALLIDSLAPKENYLGGITW